MNATTKKILQTAMLFTSLAVTNPVWSHECLQAAGKDHGASPGADQAKTLLTSERYRALHDPATNKPDGLGDYVQNFQAVSPPHR